MGREVHEILLRSISMDGGGLYGLATAIMLRRLCLADRRFLRQNPRNKVAVFAGTSAGALNALLLASTNNPRQFILNGGLDKFWRNGWDIFANKNPVTSTLSLFGFAAWLGTRDFMSYLNDYFGDRTISSLPGKVLVCTFDWYGNSTKSSDEREWTPRMFTNFTEFENSSDTDVVTYGKNWKIKDVAYGAASPPPFRATTNGQGDATIVANNPSMMTYSFLKSHFKNPQAILSIGMCLKNPSFGFQAFNFGSIPFNLMPTNVCQDNFFPAPLQVWVTGISETATLNAEQVLGPYYHRLNPPILGPPNITPCSTVQMMLARFYPWFLWLLQEIDKATVTPTADAAVAETLVFLDSENWHKGESSTWTDEYIDAVLDDPGTVRI